ncbi:MULTISPECIES: hypothetical protein [unclassified Cryobacterium]|uniref:hypothetical protein n=1 Tax=unclassified Cryobacterium TaxID=2649013 RepID=UPI00106D5B89|nr:MULTISPECIES: hypothetical protein [unclassified Cryobacterium]TFB96281.1 hypothetical protein E3O39_09245 [Cryobacterium sp. MDB2-A-1]TFC12566.1 hypothetical protein E3O35_06410 [Cryobacterium sp. MDB2-A-2]
MPARAVLRDVRDLGLAVPAGVTVQLRSLTAMQRSIPSLPDEIHGITRGRFVDSRVVPGSLVVTIRAGLPLVHFRSCLAHEYTHVAMVAAGAVSIGAAIEEGLAEYVRWSYLRQCDASPAALRIADAMFQRRHDPYGEGFRLISRTVEGEGFPRVWSQIIAGKFTIARSTNRNERES